MQESILVVIDIQEYFRIVPNKPINQIYFCSNIILLFVDILHLSIHNKTRMYKKRNNVGIKIHLIDGFVW